MTTTSLEVFETNLMHFLNRKKFPCPTPLRNKQRSFVGMYREKPYAIFEYIKGEQIEIPNTNQKRQIVHKAAELQIITKGYHSRYKAYRWNYTPRLCRALRQEAPLSHVEKKHLFDVYKLSILFDCIWYYTGGDSKDFYEKRKIDHLNALGAEQFYHELFADTQD